MEITSKIGKASKRLRGKNIDEYIFFTVFLRRLYLSWDKQIQWVYAVW
jgi:hypothetical protein